MLSTFDLTDVDEGIETWADKADRVSEEAPSELEAWAEEAIQPRNRDGKPVFFDLESGARPLAEMECFYPAPAALPLWDESMVKYGNAKREELRTQKREEHKRAYQEQLDGQAATLAAHKAAWLDKAALSPVTGRVLLIGVLCDRKTQYFGSLHEVNILSTFWAMVEDRLQCKCPLIGHNSNGFDLPFLVRRSWCLGVAVPREVRQGRFWNPLFRDTMEQWNCGSRDYVSLNTLGAFFGVGQKTDGVSGGDFAKLWFGTPEEHAKAIEYNGRDLELTAAVATKMGMV